MALNIDFDDARGLIAIRGIRYLMIQPATLVGFQKAAEHGTPISEALCAGGREGGRRSSRRLRETSSLQGREFAQAYLSMGDRIGWGLFRVTRFADREFEVEVAGSPFVEAYGASPEPVCHFTRGVIAGLGDTMFGTAECEEVACSVERCRFVCRA